LCLSCNKYLSNMGVSWDCLKWCWSIRLFYSLWNWALAEQVLHASTLSFKREWLI
jgi:hypothetical protein